MSKQPDETIYLKIDGKFKAIGRLYDIDYIGYGNYFVSNFKYGRGMHWIGAAPDPDFIRLETAVEESRDELRVAIREIVSDFVHDPEYFKTDYMMIDKVVQAIRNTFLKKKREMLKTIDRK